MSVLSEIPSDGYFSATSTVQLASSLGSGSNVESSQVPTDQSVFSSQTPLSLQGPFVRLPEDKITFSVNNTLAYQVIETSTNLGIPNALDFVSTWTDKKFYSVSLYSQACALQNLMEKWEDPQIETFLGLLNMKNYARGSLDSYWNTVNKIAITLGKPISQKHKRMYDNIRINAKELKDDRLPVSAALLVQLCDSANLFFNDYTASLAKAIFTCAWSFSMRVSEYSGSKTSGRNINTSHNIRKNSVRTSRVGLTITFESDKTTKFGKSIKHRTVIWSKIPVNAKDIVD